MPKYQVTAPDGKSWEVNAPEGATEAQVMAFAQSQWQAPKAPEKPTTLQKMQASIPGRLIQGARDPIDAAAQLLPAVWR